MYENSSSGLFTGIILGLLIVAAGILFYLYYAQPADEKEENEGSEINTEIIIPTPSILPPPPAPTPISAPGGQNQY